jgi:hypothetical protein
MLISARHASSYQAYYQSREIIGKPNAWIPRIEEIAARIGARDVLDYGCGSPPRISPYTKLRVSDYDPGVIGLDARPDPADLVVCIAALEHVEPETVDDVISDIESLARKAVFIVVGCTESSKVLPDGSAWHSFVRSPDWWRERLSEYAPQPIIRQPGTEYVALRLL